MLMPMARIPNATWLPLDAVDHDMFRKANKRGACVQSTCPRFIGVGSARVQAALKSFSDFDKRSRLCEYADGGIPGGVEILYRDESLDEVTRKKP